MNIDRFHRARMKARQEQKKDEGLYLATPSGKIRHGKLRALAKELGVGIGFEAYGRKVCAYLDIPEGEGRIDFWRFLEDRGCRVNKDYWPNGKSVEITNVSYFRAPHWDE